MRRDIERVKMDMSASPSTEWGAVLLLASVLVVGLHPMRSDAGTWPVQCPTTAGASGTNMTAASETCDCANEVQCNGLSDTGFVKKGTYNIVVVVGDDQGYCQYGFMHGYCQNNGKLCRSNVDCCDEENPANCVNNADAVCVSNRDPAPGKPLRLSEWSCRYRQPPSKRGKTNACEGVLSQSGDEDGDAGAFPFDHSSYPCPHTTTAEYQKSEKDGFVAHPVSMTPNLDRLASEGVLFTRAHVHGNSCKPSRAVMTYGMHHRHMKTAPSRPDAGTPAWVADANSDYVRVLWGKGEVISETQGGYQDGVASNGPATGRYKCSGNGKPSEGACQNAVTNADGAIADNFNGSPPEEVYPDIPSVARWGKSGLDRMLDRVFHQPVADPDGAGPLQATTVIESADVEQDGETKGTCGGSTCPSKWNAPFFLWYAPKQPHKGGAGQSYKTVYDGLGKKTRIHFARVSQVDAVVGALEDELKRSCVCVDDNGTYKAESLWENTVILYFADHGFLLPESKRTWNDNNHRTILIINDPRHRDGNPATAPRKLYEYELASSVDILQTVMDYAGGLDTPAPPFPTLPIVVGGDEKNANGYPFSRNLKPFVNGDATSERREVLYGEAASDGIDKSDNRPRYMIPRPGNIGICLNNGDPTNPVPTAQIERHDGLSFAHVKLCEAVTDCECTAAVQQNCVCQKWTGTSSTEGKRCVNNPGRACTQHSQCEPSYDPVLQTTCAAGTACDFDASKGSLADFAPDRAEDPWDNGEVPPGGFVARKCSASSQCIPPLGGGNDLGLCQPVVLKFEVDGSGGNPQAWDLNWDPDQRRDLLDDSSGYLSASLQEKLTDCLEDFHHLENGLWVPAHEWRSSQSKCPWPEVPVPPPGP